MSDVAPRACMVRPLPANVPKEVAEAAVALPAEGKGPWGSLLPISGCTSPGSHISVGQFCYLFTERAFPGNSKLEAASSKVRICHYD